VRDFDLVQSSSALRDSLLQNWAAGGDVTHCYLAVFTFFGNTAPDGPGFAIAVRTGQPKSFYMPPQVEKKLFGWPVKELLYASPGRKKS
jgi:hypothetical protein